MATEGSLTRISPLGTYGLGLTGGYGSYDSYMPYSMMNGYGMGMGMDSSIFGMGGYGLGMGGYGGMNMMLQYPLLYGQIQAQMENNQLEHAIDMQAGMNRYGVAAHKSSDRALFEKVANNGQVQYGIDNLYRTVISGDQKAIMKQFNEVRNYILQTYSKELDHLGKEINPVATANEYIKRIYSNTISAQTNQPADLEDDIRRYGESPIVNGWRQGMRKGHQGAYVDETLQYCFGRDIDEKANKDFSQTVGKVAGHITQPFAKGAVGAGIGAAAGATAYVVGGGAVSLTKKAFGGNLNKFKFGALGKWAYIGALAAGAAAFIGDAIWQFTGNKATS